jgi:hypothetical protein
MPAERIVEEDRWYGSCMYAKRDTSNRIESRQDDVFLQVLRDGRIQLFRLKPYSREETGLVSIADVRSKQNHLASRFILHRLNKSGKIEGSPISPITEHRHHRLVPPQLLGDHRSSDDVQSGRSADVKTLFV